MEDNQIIWPIDRLIGNPRVFQAVANHFEGPDWELFASTFYDLIEHELQENDNPSFPDGECCFREKPDEPEIFQVILSNGNAIELRPSEDDQYFVVKNEEEMGVVSAIYGRLVKAIEAARPDLKDDIALCEVRIARRELRIAAEDMTIKNSNEPNRAQQIFGVE